MSFLFCILQVLIFVVVCGAVELPSFIIKCNKNSEDLNDCIKNSTNAALGQLSEGVNKIRFPSLKPLVVTKTDVIANGLNLTLNDNNIYGIDKLRIDNVEVDLTKKYYKFEGFIPVLSNIGKYDVNGRLLVLPIYGSGDINATFVNLNVNFTFDYDLFEDKGKMYMNPKNGKFDYITERAYFQLNNLFDGNEVLSTEMNKFLNENWKEVNNEVGTGLGNVIGHVLVQILRGFMEKVPFDEFYI